MKHHPNFIGTEPVYPGSSRVRPKFRPFTGREPEPDCDWDRNLSQEENFALRDEYEAAHRLWAVAKFKLDVHPHLLLAVPAWTEYLVACREMDEAYAALERVSDGSWRAHLMVLDKAWDRALKAAKAWDVIAKDISTLYWRSGVAYGEATLVGLAKELGVDAAGWHVDGPDEYDPGYWGQTPLVKKVSETVDEQKERIARVAQLAGDR